jgi:SPP1 gp7 family putative phage head morphogenesis protein
MKYWQDRLQEAQNNLTARKRREVERQLRRYYTKLSKKVIEEYESLYNQVLLKKAAGETISPATLYQMDKYWSMQQQIRARMRDTGAKFQTMLSKIFEIVYRDSYDAIKIEGLTAFRTIDDGAVQQVLNNIWAADGKSWSERIWNNMTLLQTTLEEGLLECVATGKKSSDLKKVLQNKFSVSYNRADTLVRTEMAHIQTEAAKQRYSDYGIEQVEIWADPDERTCPVCSKLHKKKYPVNALVPIPAHPRCRCCVVPVVKIPD